MTVVKFPCHLAKCGLILTIKKGRNYVYLIGTGEASMMFSSFLTTISISRVNVRNYRSLKNTACVRVDDGHSNAFFFLKASFQGALESAWIF